MTSRIKLESFSTSRSRKQARKVFDEEIVPDHVATVLAIAQTQNDAVTVRSLLLSVSMADGFEDKVGSRGAQFEQDALEMVLGQHLRQPFVHDLPTGGGHTGGGRKARRFDLQSESVKDWQRHQSHSNPQALRVPQ